MKVDRGGQHLPRLPGLLAGLGPAEKVGVRTQADLVATRSREERKEEREEVVAWRWWERRELLATSSVTRGGRAWAEILYLYMWQYAI